MSNLTSFITGAITFFSGLVGHTETVVTPLVHTNHHKMVITIERSIFTKIARYFADNTPHLVFL